MPGKPRKLDYVCKLCSRPFSRAPRKGGCLYCSNACADAGKKKSTLEKFLGFVGSKTATGCRLWTGCVHKNGYGAIGVDGCGKSLAHRVAYELFVSPIPDGLWVLHRCDTPACVQPTHLFLGSPQDNVDDMRSKGRGTIGDNHPNSKLTDQEVAIVRELYDFALASQKELAAYYGVGKQTINAIVNRKSRKHV